MNIHLWKVEKMKWKEMADSTPTEIQLSDGIKGPLTEGMEEMFKQSVLRLLVVGDC